MKVNPHIDPHVIDSPQLDERLWQQWTCKNRESDRIGAARRLKGLQILLAFLLVVAIVRDFTQ